MHTACRSYIRVSVVVLLSAALLSAQEGTLKPGTGSGSNVGPIVVGGMKPVVIPMNGSLICPIIEPRMKLVKGCAFEAARAIFISKAPSECDEGSFVDNRNGGECWSCPAGFVRSSLPVDSGNACWKAVGEDLKTATLAGKSTGLSCSAGAFHDPADGGTCWTCPAGYRRTLNQVKGTGACAKTLATQYARATFNRKSSCSAEFAPVGYGTPVKEDSRGECWACPQMLSRSLAAVDSGNACMVGSDTESILWQSPQYPEPGVYFFIDGLLDTALADPKVVDAFLEKRANGNAQKKRELWRKMIETPGESAELKALLFASLLTVANRANASNSARFSVDDFEKYIRARRTFVAQEARSMYDAWLGVENYNKWQKTRAAAGLKGSLDLAILGSKPPNFLSLAWATSAPDQVGNEFMEAFEALEVVSLPGAASPSSTGGFDPTYVKGVASALRSGIEKYNAVAGRVTRSGIEAISKAGRAMQFTTAFRAMFVTLTVVKAAFDLYEATSILVEQAAVERRYANIVADANKAVSVRQMLNSGKDEDKQQLLLYWALATSSYEVGPKVGIGFRNHARLCAELNIQCQKGKSAVLAAARQAGY